MTALEVVPQSTSVLGTQSQLDLLKTTIASGLTDGEFELFAAVCQRTGLDPFVKQIYAVKRYSKRDGRDVMTIQVGIDGYRLIADRTGKYAGNDDAVFTGQVDGKYPELASVTVWKIVGGQRCPFTASARWVEYVPNEKQDAMWRRMSHVMLAKVAEALALRKAFPAELSGFYTSEEMAQADVTITPVEPVAVEVVEAAVPVEPPVPPDGFDDMAEAVANHASVKGVMVSLTDQERAGLTEWRTENGLSGWPLPRAALLAVSGEVARLLQSREPVNVGVVPDEGSAAPGEASELPASPGVPSDPPLPSLDAFDGDAAPKDPLTRMTRDELVAECVQRDLPVSGARQRLIASIVEYDERIF